MGKRVGERPARRVDRRVAALRRFAASISVFVVVAHWLLGMETPWAAPVVALAASYTFELGLEALDAWAHRRRPRFAGGIGDLVTFLLPAHISGLAISMLIYPGDRLWPYVFAAAVGAGAKYLLRAPVNGSMRHIMNPSNLGIATTLVLFPWVGIAMPYHFSETTYGIVDWLIPLGILGSGLMLNLQLTGKGPLIAGWILGFAGQAVVRAALTDVSLVGALAPMTGVAFILFTNYMITDPGTTPARPRQQVVFALAAAAVYGAFMALHIVFGIFFCLVVVCGVRGVLLWARALLDARATRPAAPPLPAIPDALKTAAS